ncbi:hypothetical protein G5714_020576 [Onychostoma macrolepis]|uniref:Uncharacterized protein n=1 Tax=Onychostoma macrolepis TaxID=369639 RepID=A0A7J6BU69_9TELE|nr:hypothetical protein G5714_020576 [Onychostoma macrolepis]
MAAADFTNLVGSVEQGYTAILAIEDTLATHLSPSSVPSWKSGPVLPTKPFNSVVEKFRTAKSQSAALRQFMPRRAQDSSITPSSSGSFLTLMSGRGEFSPKPHKAGPDHSSISARL